MQQYGYSGLEIAPTRIFPERPYEKLKEAKSWSENLKKEYSIEIDKKKVLLPETIKNLGTFTVEIKLYEGIIAKLKLNVVA